VKTEVYFVGFVSCFLFQIRLYRKSSETSPLQLILHEEDEEDENYTGLKNFDKFCEFSPFSGKKHFFHALRNVKEFWAQKLFSKRTEDKSDVF